MLVTEAILFITKYETTVYVLKWFEVQQLLLYFVLCMFVSLFVIILIDIVSAGSCVFACVFACVFVC